MFSNSSVLLTASICLLFAENVNANDASLYAETPPDDASFVRFIGFADTTNVEFGGKAFDLAGVDQNAYVPVSASHLEAISAGSYFSVLRDQSQIIPIEEGPRDTRSKVHLFLVNGTDAALDLRLSDNSATVIDAVGSGQSGQRAVNPVSVSFGVFPDGGDTPLAEFEVSLKRGQNLSFVADARGVHLIDNIYGSVAK